VKTIKDWRKLKKYEKIHPEKEKNGLSPEKTDPDRISLRRTTEAVFRTIRAVVSAGKELPGPVCRFRRCRQHPASSRKHNILLELQQYTHYLFSAKNGFST